MTMQPDELQDYVDVLTCIRQLLALERMGVWTVRVGLRANHEDLLQVAVLRGIFPQTTRNARQRVLRDLTKLDKHFQPLTDEEISVIIDYLETLD